MIAKRLCRFIVSVPLVFVVAFTGQPGMAQDDGASDPESNAAQLMTRETDEAIQRGLKFLVARQNPDGSFGKSKQYSRNVAVVSLAGLAMMAEGSTPERGRYRKPLSKAVDFVLAHCREDGFITHSEYQSHGPMYGHGFATLFLTQVYGTTSRNELKEKLSAAVKLIIETQNDRGGWRYEPRPNDADISVTVCQVMALRAARDAGFTVPAETIDQAVAFVKRCQNTDGGFGYRLNDGSASEFPRTAAAIVTFHSAGVYDGRELELALDYLDGYRADKRTGPRDGHYYYGHYYGIQAMWQAGGERWNDWYSAIRDDLLNVQSIKDGHFPDAISPEYGTAMACIILQLPNNLLPIFQR